MIDGSLGSIARFGVGGRPLGSFATSRVCGDGIGPGPIAGVVGPVAIGRDIRMVRLMMIFAGLRGRVGIEGPDRIGIAGTG